MTAGNEEHEPLITSSVDNQRVAFNNSPPDGRSPESSPRGSGNEVTLAIPAQRNYGAIGGVEKVTYTWADINAFATESRARSRRTWNFWKPSASGMFQQRKQLLRNVNGAAYPGELLAIMGSSGAGKTTLLNTLTFRTPSGVLSSGTRALNGQPATPEALSALSAYVQQQDLFIGTLTVKEHLIFQAMVRMDRHIPYAQRMRRVQEVITELALTKCQNTVIGIPGRLKGISGGEMKRLSFASEVLTDPPLMFCDEPTSGLDSFMAQNVLQVLKGLAQKGKTVVCTIHQPSSELYAMFDKLLIMADGKVAFLGSPDQANDFFKDLGAACPPNYNPADHFIQLLAGVPGREETTRTTIDTVCTAFARSEIGCKVAAEAENALYFEVCVTVDHFIQLLAGVPGREETTRTTIDTVCTAFARSEIGCKVAAEAENALYFEVCVTVDHFIQLLAGVPGREETTRTTIDTVCTAFARSEIGCKVAAEAENALYFEVCVTVDHFIQLLAGVPGREETTRTTIDTVCTAFARSEIGCKVAAEAENALYFEVCVTVDHFIQLLAGVPGREETTRTTIDTVCTAFARSEIGCKVAAEAENALYFEVCVTVDHFIQLLAGVPGREETTRTTIDTVCTAFARSEIGCKVAAEAENALYFEVCVTVDHFIQLLAGVPGREETTRTTIDTVCTAFARSEIGCKVAAEAENALYFEVSVTVDHFIQLLAGVPGREETTPPSTRCACELMRKISSGWADPAWSEATAMRARRSPYKASWCAQFRAVLWRSWLSVTKEPMLIKVRFLQTIMVSILIGVIYFGQSLDQDGVMNINGAIFMFLTNMTFQNIFAVINVFCSELPIFIREHHSGMYRADVYFLSKTLAEAPVFATIPLVFTTIAYYMIGLNPEPKRFFIASGLAALITNVATSFGYLISCASNSVSMAASVGPPIIIPFMLFGGFFLNTGSVPPYLGWISYLSWFHYGNEALLVNQWSGVETISCTRENFTCPASGQVVLDTLSFSEDDFTMDVVSMVLLFIGFRFLAYLALLYRARRGK
ncbi:hypothetical protein PYW07_004087 [Mythimna separata]|uniref:Protein white n=1 Tax=Mythimna separata TaxID=271217 RepID=A0AAD8DTP6_MYTSE|nr:hypothetical protein PYW07_004087 [Mythimna separata]